MCDYLEKSFSDAVLFNMHVRKSSPAKYNPGMNT